MVANQGFLYQFEYSTCEWNDSFWIGRKAWKIDKNAGIATIVEDFFQGKNDVKSVKISWKNWISIFEWEQK